MTGRGSWWPSWALAMALLDGCGRLGFDAVSSSGIDDARNNDATGMDALTIDTPPGAVTIVVGERTGTDVRGVTADTTLKTSQSNRNFGATSALVVDDSTNALLRFDLSSIPTTATLVSASVTLWTTPAESSANLVEMFEVLEDWVEGTGGDLGTFEPANYDERTPLVAWIGPGVTMGSRGARAGAMTPMVEDSAYTSQLAASVVSVWLAVPAANNGVVLDLAGNDAVSFVSSDSASTAKRPVLTIVYVP